MRSKPYKSGGKILLLRETIDYETRLQRIDIFGRFVENRNTFFDMGGVLKIVSIQKNEKNE